MIPLQLSQRGKLLSFFTPQLQLETLFVIDHEGRIVSTREPNASTGPRFALIRDRHSCAWAVHRDVPDLLNRELVALARTEPPVKGFSDEPVHGAVYNSLLAATIEAGPAFTFPTTIVAVHDAVPIADVSLLERHFRGWSADEMPERSPIFGILDDGHAVSVCFCARRSSAAAEAGLETAPSFRGRGFGGLVTARWAKALLDSGRLPVYSTSWANTASLAVARKLGLRECASDWSLYAKA